MAMVKDYLKNNFKHGIEVVSITTWRCNGNYFARRCRSFGNFRL